MLALSLAGWCCHCLKDRVNALSLVVSVRKKCWTLGDSIEGVVGCWLGTGTSEAYLPNLQHYASQIFSLWLPDAPSLLPFTRALGECPRASLCSLAFTENAWDSIRLPPLSNGLRPRLFFLPNTMQSSSSRPWSSGLGALALD